MGLLKVSGEMGCGSSRRSGEKELHLHGSNLRFSQRHLAALNAHFSDLIDTGYLKEPGQEKVMVLIERLIQRLVCGVGVLDRRFASKFLVSLEPHKIKCKPGNSLSYLVRLDALSTPELYPDSGGLSCTLVEGEGGPQGFAKMRVSGQEAQNWAEFISHQGYLRRDKIQERFVELLAQSAARSGVVGKPEEVDESRLCGAPGKVVDAETLHHLLQIPARQHVFYGTAECYRSKYPDPREFRIAIVEGCSCIRLRIGMVYSGNGGVETDVEVTLVLGVGFTSWPNSAQFPARINLCHIDCLLYHQAASTGFYVVPAPPHPTLRCDDRSTVWQIRFPAAEQTLFKHYSNNSVPLRVLYTLRSILHDIRSTTSSGHVISDYMLKTLLWFRLEEEESSAVRTMQNWTHDSLAAHVLVILDRLVVALKTQRQSSYFFPWFNVMLNSPGGGTLHYSEEDYWHDAELVTSYLRRLNDLSSPDIVQSVDTDCWRKMESTLVRKWSDVLTDLTPPPATRSRRLSFAPVTSTGQSSIAASQYSLRQLDYIGQILKSMLTIRSLTLTKNNDLPSWFHNPGKDVSSKSEDLVYLLSTILEQAKQFTLGPLKPTSTVYRTSKVKQKRGKTKSLCDLYDSSVNGLLEEVRRDRTAFTSEDDSSVVRQVLKWLYFGMDRDRKNIGSVLRSYLGRLFIVSHENCWHVPEWRRRHDRDELEALGKFTLLLVERKITLKEGVIDAYRKGWSWAESILKNCTDLAEGVELIFIPSSGKVIRRKLTNTKLDDPTTFSTRSLGRRPATVVTKGNYSSATLPRHIKPFRECLKSRLQRSKSEHEEFSPTKHNLLRNSSPMTQTLEATHRYGNHRGLGSIVHALITLRKFTVLQEVSGLLPEGDRAQILDEIQRVSREIRRPRRSEARRAATPGYRSSEEWSGHGQSPTTPPPHSTPHQVSISGTLLGTCRVVRRRGGTYQPALYTRALFEEAVSPIYQPLTATNPGFFTPSLEDEMIHLNRSSRWKQSSRNQAVTKL